MFSFKHSLSQKIRFISLSGIFIFGSLVCVFYIYKERKERFSTISSEIVKTGSFLVPHSYILLKQRNLANILHMTQVVHENVKNGNFSYVEIVDAQLHLAVPYDPLGLGSKKMHTRSLQNGSWSTLALGQGHIIRSQRYEDVGPVMEGAFGIVERDRILGYVVLGVSKRPVIESANKNLFGTLGVMFLLWAFAVGVTWRWNRNKLERVTHIEKMASFDAMTGLLNRQSLMEKAAVEFARCHRRGDSLYLILFDLDHFKTINDTYGHLVGDKVICTFAKILSRARRAGEEVGRFGGEEFLLLLPDTDTGGVVKVAQKILEDVREISVSLADGEELQFKVSIGAAGFPQNGFSLEEVLHKADKALYLAKSRGRNQMVVWNKNCRSTTVPFLKNIGIGPYFSAEK